MKVRSKGGMWVTFQAGRAHVAGRQNGDAVVYEEEEEVRRIQFTHGLECWHRHLEDFELTVTPKNNVIIQMCS